MASKVTFLTNVKYLFRLLNSSLNNSLNNITKFPNQQGIFGAPSLSYDYGLVSNVTSDQQGCRPASLSEIFGSILHFKVPRNRRTLERRLTRKHSEPFINNARPKKNIITCLACGQPHEAETICDHCYGKVQQKAQDMSRQCHCYSKVREETQDMRKAMSDDVYYYDHPRKEVAYLYNGEDIEDFPKYKGRYIVEIDKKRPSWFPKELLDNKKKNNS